MCSDCEISHLEISPSDTAQHETPHASVPDLRKSLPFTSTLNKKESHHLKHVLRLKVGSEVELLLCDSNNQSAVFQAIVKEHGNSGEVTLLCRQIISAPAYPKLTLAFPLIKLNRLETLIEKATELGVEKILLYESSHQRADISAKKIAKKLERLYSIRDHALKQSRSHVLTNISLLGELQSLETGSFTMRLCPMSEKDSSIWPETEKRKSFQDLTSLYSEIKIFDQDVDLLLVIGPEGGFCKNESEFLHRTRCIPMSLGPNILRAETAAIAAISMLRALNKE